MKYRKKPIEIEAMQWLGGAANATPVIDWMLSNGGTATYHEPDYISGQGTEGIWVRTLEGTMTANPGDWIIQGVQGEFYPCKPDIFEQTYEPVDETESA